MITSLISLITEFSVAHDVLVLSAVIAIGLALGRLKAGGFRLGIAGVLFAGIFFGHFRLTISPEHIHFIKEFGLVLFVYAIGMQVGPGFFASFKREGLKLNMMAFSIVALGVLITTVLIAGLRIPTAAAVGLFSGGTTNTPSLGAAQATLAAFEADEITLKIPGLAYAMAYPFGVMGIILTMVLLKTLFRIAPQEEAASFQKSQMETAPPLESLNLVIENKNLDGVMIKEIPGPASGRVNVSRIMHEENVSVAGPDTKVHLGDIIHVIGTPAHLHEMKVLTGSISPIDLRGDVITDITARKIIFTNKKNAKMTVRQLQQSGFGDIAITRIWRAGIEFPARPEMELQFGDTLLIVATADTLAKTAEMLGDSRKAMETPEMMPFFLGILMGVFLGSIPFHIPGVPVPVKLGLAGGPLLVAIVLSSYGSVGRISWYVPQSANHMIREIGITLFLACVGLNSGDQFVATLVHGPGLFWMLLASIITFVPLMATGAAARYFFKINYLSICGLLAGSMTDPPALAFANSQCESPATSVAYASVYPLVMILRVVSAQLIVIFFH